MTTTFKAIAKKPDVKASAIYALKSGVAVRTVKNQLREHGMEVKAMVRRDIIALLEQA